MRAAVCVIACAGCHFSAGHAAGDAGLVDARDAAAASDAADASLDAPPPACAASGLSDPFTGTAPCMSWGSATTSHATVTEGGGALTVAVGNHDTAFGGCTETDAGDAWDADGEMIEVTQIAGGATGYTVLNAYAIGGGITGTIVAKAGNLTLHDGNMQMVQSLPYDGTAMQWWRLRPTATGITGEYSADARQWRLIGTLAGTAPATIRIDFGAGSDLAEPSAGSATFRNLDLCP